MTPRKRLADDIAYYATFQTTYHNDSVESCLSPCPELSSCSSDSASTPGLASSSASASGSLSALPEAFPSSSLLPSPSLHTPPCLPPYSLPYFSPTPHTILQQRKSKQVRRLYLSLLRREHDGEVYSIINDVIVDEDQLSGLVTSLTQKLAMESIIMPAKRIWKEMEKSKCNTRREELDKEEKGMERELRKKRMTPEDWEEEIKIEKVKRKIGVLKQMEKIRGLREEIQKAGREIKMLRRE
ncbi:hypothetical protein FPQ18DRAFT_415752 [Pyronema domesticum]|nr:hypothetical protein FPQ18DRAFT_415752 [Pyronema domesticum]